MAAAPTIGELLLRWRELRQRGQECSPEQLCADSPELLDEVRRQIDAVESMERRLGFAGNGDPGTTPATVLGASSARSLSDEPNHHDAASVVDPFLVPGYELLEVLDRGGMGIVYKARQIRLKRLVALKMILAGAHAQPQHLARFRVEAEAVARLHHPHIVQIYDVGEADGQAYFSMEFVEGGNLAQRLGGKPLPPRQAAQLAATLADAVHAAHERGIVHRDLKPGNILLECRVPNAECRLDEKDQGGSSFGNRNSAFGNPKITDFGLAKLVDTESKHTHTGTIMGTPSYMAPEQAEGKVREIGPLADVYALGAILYEMLTGRPPFEGAAPMETLMRVVSQEPLPPSRLQNKIPSDLETVCLKCLEKSPRRRYATAQALADDLRRFTEGLPIAARRTSLLGKSLRWTRRRPELAILSTLLALATVGLVVAMGLRYRAQQQVLRTADQLAPRARQILHKYCYECHGQDPKNVERDLDILDYALLRDEARGLLIPGDPNGSKLIHRIEDGSMPPEEEEECPRLSSDDIEVLKSWVAGGAPPFPEPEPREGDPPDEQPTELSRQVKEIFRVHCHACHRLGNAKNGIKILNHDLLIVKRKVVVPRKPEESSLYQVLFAKDPKKVMPPPKSERLQATELEAIRQWILEGARPFPRTREALP